ncbi:MAG: HI0074 family nucleotidyltransferase substrate-binding subunit [Bdellovibrionales bacterium]
MATVSIEEFRKAVAALVEAHIAFEKQEDVSLKDMLRDAVIQRFEFCVELAWKTSIKKLGLAVTAPKPAMREMGRSGLIENVERWLDFVDARNKSSHTYDERIAREVLDVIPDFLDSVRELLQRLKA